MVTNQLKLTIGDKVEKFLSGLQGGVATFKEIYSAIPETPEESIRCAVYRDKKGRFKKVTKGMYMLVGKNTASLLLKGDSRQLGEIEDESIDTIITDHPWSDSKAHKSGNQKSFAQYETFKYTLEDFKHKARVLKDGGYLVEFLPVESFSNYDYLYQLKSWAKEAGLNYYTKITWRKAPEGTINTGRTTKGVEDICIFYKGKKPRRLSATTKPYFTRNILPFTVNIPIKTKDKVHQAEKPIELYQFLLEQLTEEYDICLDQYGGSCNLLKAAVNTNRFSIVYEKCAKFVKNAVERFGCMVLYEGEEILEEVVEKENNVQQQALILDFEPVSIHSSLDLAKRKAMAIKESQEQQAIQEQQQKLENCRAFTKRYLEAICLYDQHRGLTLEQSELCRWSYIAKQLNLQKEMCDVERLDVEMCQQIYHLFLPLARKLKIVR